MGGLNPPIPPQTAGTFNFLVFFFFVAFVLPNLLIYTHIFFNLKLTYDLLSCKLTFFLV